MPLLNPSKGWSSSTSRLLALYSFLFVAWSSILMGVLYFEVSSYLSKLTRHSMLQRQHLFAHMSGKQLDDALIASQAFEERSIHRRQGAVMPLCRLSATGSLNECICERRADHQHRRNFTTGRRIAGNGGATTSAFCCQSLVKTATRAGAGKRRRLQTAAISQRQSQPGRNTARILCNFGRFSRRQLAQIRNINVRNFDRLGFRFWHVVQIGTQQCLDLGGAQHAARCRDWTIRCDWLERRRHVEHDVGFPSGRHVPAVIGSKRQIIGHGSVSRLPCSSLFCVRYG